MRKVWIEVNTNRPHFIKVIKHTRDNLKFVNDNKYDI